MNYFILRVGFLFFLAGIFACSGGRKVAKEEIVKGPVGVWQGLVSGTPNGDIPIEIVLSQGAEGYTGMINSEIENMKISNLKIEDNKVTGSFYSQSYGQDIYFDATYVPDSDTIEGWIMDEFKLTGKRKVVDGM